MENLNLEIGRHLKEIRSLQKMTLEDVAIITGVSKPMLGQIERGQSIPTVTTLWKIATGLKVPLFSFFAEQQMDYSVVNITDQESISGDNGRMRAYTLFSYDPIQNLEIFYIEFDKGCQHKSAKHNNGVSEYILVLAGKLQLVLNDQEIIVHEKQAVRFRANMPHAYNNPFDAKCSVYNIIFYPSR